MLNWRNTAPLGGFSRLNRPQVGEQLSRPYMSRNKHLRHTRERKETDMKKTAVVCLLGGTLLLAACGAPTTPTQAQAQNDARCAAGILGGAALGGVLGNQVGSGTGQTLATAAGAGLEIKQINTFK